MGAGGVHRETSVRGGHLRKGHEGVAGRAACEGRATRQQEQCEGLGHTLCTERNSKEATGRDAREGEGGGEETREADREQVSQPVGVGRTSYSPHCWDSRVDQSTQRPGSPPPAGTHD